MIKHMEKEYIIIVMVLNIQENEKMINKMGNIFNKDSFYIPV